MADRYEPFDEPTKMMRVMFPVQSETEYNIVEKIVDQNGGMIIDAKWQGVVVGLRAAQKGLTYETTSFFGCRKKVYTLWENFHKDVLVVPDTYVFRDPSKWNKDAKSDDPMDNKLPKSDIFVPFTRKKPLPPVLEPFRVKDTPRFIKEQILEHKALDADPSRWPLYYVPTYAPDGRRLTDWEKGAIEQENRARAKRIQEAEDRTKQGSIPRICSCGTRYRTNFALPSETCPQCSQADHILEEIPTPQDELEALKERTGLGIGQLREIVSGKAKAKLLKKAVRVEKL